jgi:capsid protein
MTLPFGSTQFVNGVPQAPAQIGGSGRAYFNLTDAIGGETALVTSGVTVAGTTSGVVVGPAGFTLQARVYDTADQPDAGANDAIEAAFARWSALGVCDVSGHSSFRDLCRMLATAAARDGEFLVRIVRGKSAGNAFGIALQAIDIDRLDTKLNDATKVGNKIRMGVEINEFGRPAV